MPGHDDQVKALIGADGFGGALDPCDLVTVWFTSGDVEHGDCGINSDNAMTKSGKGVADETGAATKIENVLWWLACEGYEKIPIFSARIAEVIDLGEFFERVLKIGHICGFV